MYELIDRLSLLGLAVLMVLTIAAVSMRLSWLDKRQKQDDDPTSSEGPESRQSPK